MKNRTLSNGQAVSSIGLGCMAWIMLMANLPPGKTWSNCSAMLWIWGAHS